MSDLCPCDSKEKFSDCCGAFISGDKLPPSAEATMRSRYSAYVKCDMDYIESTHHPSTLDTFDKKESKSWAEEAQWLGLEIINSNEEDGEAVVEFECRYNWDGEEKTHHEISHFQKENDKWYFVDGKVLGQPIERMTPKIGRNEPCPCGSGKKYKKCCLNA